MILKRSRIISLVMAVSMLAMACSSQDKDSVNIEATSVGSETTTIEIETETKSKEEKQQEFIKKIAEANVLETVLKSYNVNIGQIKTYYDAGETVNITIHIDRDKYVHIFEDGDWAGYMDIFLKGEHFYLFDGELQKYNYINSSYDLDYALCTQDIIFCDRDDMQIISLEETDTEIILQTNVSVESFVKGQKVLTEFALQQERANYNSININYTIDKETYLIKNKTMERVDTMGNSVLYYEEYRYEYSNESYHLPDQIQDDINSENYELQEI